MLKIKHYKVCRVLKVFKKESFRRLNHEIKEKLGKVIGCGGDALPL
jgi:hypothetical protein